MRMDVEKVRRTAESVQEGDENGVWLVDDAFVRGARCVEVHHGLLRDDEPTLLPRPLTTVVAPGLPAARSMPL